MKAFECDICHKTFRRSFTLKQHKLIHERENKNVEAKPVGIEIKSEIKKENCCAPGHSHSHSHSHSEGGNCCGPKEPCFDTKVPFIPEQTATIEDIEVDVCGVANGGVAMSPEHSSSTGDSLDLSVDSDQDQMVQTAENRKEQSGSPHSHSDSGHGSPNAKLEHSSEEEATNSGSDDSGAVIQEKPRFYRPFEDAEKPVAQAQWNTQKRRQDDIPIDITQTKRVRDGNGKIVVYPGIRDSTQNRINPTRLSYRTANMDFVNCSFSALDELRQAAGNNGQNHWESLRSDQEFLWRRLGRLSIKTTFIFI